MDASRIEIRIFFATQDVLVFNSSSKTQKIRNNEVKQTAAATLRSGLFAWYPKEGWERRNLVVMPGAC